MAQHGAHRMAGMQVKQKKKKNTTDPVLQKMFKAIDSFKANKLKVKKPVDWT